MARLQSGGLILLFMAPMTLVQAATLIKDRSYMHQVPRQLGVGQGASTSTSTFNYWWPYPAWTATAAATSPAAATATGMATTTALLSISTTLIPTSALLQDGVLATLSIPSPDSSSILPASSSSLTTLSETSLPASTSSASSSSVSESPTPLSSPTTPHPSSSFPSRGFFTSPHFLIPLIAAVSTTVVLSLLLWWICRHRRRARVSSSSFSTKGKKGEWWSRLFKGRSGEFEEMIPGPKYVSVEDDLEEHRCVEKEEEEDTRCLLGKNGGKEQGGRLDIASWAAQASGGGDGGGSGGGPILKRKRSGTRLSRGSRHSRTKRGGSMSVNRPLLLSSPPSSFALAAIGSSNELSDEEEGDGFEDDDEDKPEMRVPWESLRHKSIKRAILAKVDEEKRWTDSMRGVRAARAVRAVQAVGSPTVVETERGTSPGHRNNKGFRIVVDESPPVRIPTPAGWSGSGRRSPPWFLASAFPFPLFSSGDRQRAGGGEEEEEEGEDKYTPVPSPSGSRSRSRNRSRRSSLRQDRPFYHQRQKRVQGEDLSPSPSPSPSRVPRPGYYRPSPSVLRIRSPPSVMTPQMESALCFTPIVEASARMEDDIDEDENEDEEEDEKPGMVYTETCRDRADRAIRRVEAIVESAWSDRGRD